MEFGAGCGGDGGGLQGRGTREEEAGFPGRELGKRWGAFGAGPGERRWASGAGRMEGEGWFRGSGAGEGAGRGRGASSSARVRRTRRDAPRSPPAVQPALRGCSGGAHVHNDLPDAPGYGIPASPFSIFTVNC